MSSLRTSPRTGHQARTWPDDCPAPGCGRRMQFAFPPSGPRRVCSCGVTVTAAQALTGRHNPAPKPLKKAA